MERREEQRGRGDREQEEERRANERIRERSASPGVRAAQPRPRVRPHQRLFPNPLVEAQRREPYVWTYNDGRVVTPFGEFPANHWSQRNSPFHPLARSMPCERCVGAGERCDFVPGHGGGCTGCQGSRGRCNAAGTVPGYHDPLDVARYEWLLWHNLTEYAREWKPPPSDPRLVERDIALLAGVTHVEVPDFEALVRGAGGAARLGGGAAPMDHQEAEAEAAAAPRTPQRGPVQRPADGRAASPLSPERRRPLPVPDRGFPRRPAPGEASPIAARLRPRNGAPWTAGRGGEDPFETPAPVSTRAHDTGIRAVRPASSRGGAQAERGRREEREETAPAPRGGVGVALGGLSRADLDAVFDEEVPEDARSAARRMQQIQDFCGQELPRVYDRFRRCGEVAQSATLPSLRNLFPGARFPRQERTAQGDLAYDMSTMQAPPGFFFSSAAAARNAQIVAQFHHETQGGEERAATLPSWLGAREPARGAASASARVHEEAAVAGTAGATTVEGAAEVGASGGEGEAGETTGGS